MVTSVKPVQPANASLPIFVTLSGMVTFVKSVQPLKACSPISFTLSPMESSFRDDPLKLKRGTVLQLMLRALILQPEKAEEPILVTPFPMVTLVMLLQS